MSDYTQEEIEGWKKKAAAWDKASQTAISVDLNSVAFNAVRKSFEIYPPTEHPFDARLRSDMFKWGYQAVFGIGNFENK